LSARKVACAANEKPATLVPTYRQARIAASVRMEALAKEIGDGLKSVHHADMIRPQFRCVSMGRDSRRLPMRRPTLTILLTGALVALAAQPIAAQSPAPRQVAPGPAAAPQPLQEPYKKVAVTVPNAPRDAAFESLRKELAEIAKRKDRAALAQRIVAKGFFWERDFSGGFDPKRPSIDNLAGALTLEADDGTGWDALAVFAAETSAGPLPGRPSVMCAPAIPQFDEDARDQLADSTQSDGLEWNYPRSAGLQVRAAPQNNASVIETLGLHFVRVLGFEDKEGDSDPVHNSWARVATPSGKTGFAAPNSLLSPYADRLCYGKEGNGPWRIVGYVGGGD
jgi:hypothetical protein